MHMPPKGVQKRVPRAKAAATRIVGPKAAAKRAGTKAKAAAALRARKARTRAAVDLSEVKRTSELQQYMQRRNAHFRQPVAVRAEGAEARRAEARARRALVATRASEALNATFPGPTDERHVQGRTAPMTTGAGLHRPYGSPPRRRRAGPKGG